jgi:hypothetical protein
MAKKSHSGKFASGRTGPGRGWFVFKSLSAMQLEHFDIFYNSLALRLLYYFQAGFLMRL